MPTEPVPTPVKPGYATTEFWHTLVVSVVGLLVGTGVISTPIASVVGPAVDAATAGANAVIAQPGPWYVRVAGFVMAALASWGYSQSRGSAKSGAGQA